MGIFGHALLVGSFLLNFASAARTVNHPIPPTNYNVNASEFGDTVSVALPYGVYHGFHNTSSNLNIWKSIRYASAPTGTRRWQPPKRPTSSNPMATHQARYFKSRCPQSPNNPYKGDPCPGLATSNELPDRCFSSDYFQETIIGDEDCLFLSVYAPPGKVGLPVMVWIHGGGYGQGDGGQDLGPIIKANNDGFVGVAIQYRLGAFGFLSSQELKNRGAVNAGLLDQHEGLRWVQDFISLFGGDPKQVTIVGNSAGAGSVMLQDMAYGGSLGTSMFKNSIASSPYLPPQWDYNAQPPTQAYNEFASAVGCTGSKAFDCLVKKDTYVLQQASALVSADDLYGDWKFIPVTDGDFVQQLPSRQLIAGQVNGENMLVGNNANEGPDFTPPNITTEKDFRTFVADHFPLFSTADLGTVETYYPSTKAPVNPNAPLFATNGLNPPTALNQSTFATGQQQRADNLYAETTFVCPSYWMAEAYDGNGKKGYKYQFSVPPASHADDIQTFLGPFKADYVTADFQLALMRIWGNFVIKSDPNLSPKVANGASSPGNKKGNGATKWPTYSPATHTQLNLNLTGGVPSTFVHNNTGTPKTVHVDVSTPSAQQANTFTLVDAYKWEGGRGIRCDFWKNVGLAVPESLSTPPQRRRERRRASGAIKN